MLCLVNATFNECKFIFMIWGCKGMENWRHILSSPLSFSCLFFFSCVCLFLTRPLFLSLCLPSVSLFLSVPPRSLPLSLSPFLNLFHPLSFSLCLSVSISTFFCSDLIYTVFCGTRMQTKWSGNAENDLTDLQISTKKTIMSPAERFEMSIESTMEPSSLKRDGHDAPVSEELALSQCSGRGGECDERTRAVSSPTHSQNWPHAASALTLFPLRKVTFLWILRCHRQAQAPKNAKYFTEKINQTTSLHDEWIVLYEYHWISFHIFLMTFPFSVFISCTFPRCDQAVAPLRIAGLCDYTC